MVALQKYFLTVIARGDEYVKKPQEKKGRTSKNCNDGYVRPPTPREAIMKHPFFASPPNYGIHGFGVIFCLFFSFLDKLFDHLLVLEFSVFIAHALSHF